MPMLQRPRDFHSTPQGRMDMLGGEVPIDKARMLGTEPAPQNGPFGSRRHVRGPARRRHAGAGKRPSGYA